MLEPLGRITAYSSVISTRYNPDKFVGREWLIEEVTRFRDDEDRQYLVIVGEPGSGKSTFLAYLAESWNCLRYFIRVDNSSGVSGVDPRAFLVSLGSQLYQKYGPHIFERDIPDTTRVIVGWAKDQSEVIGRFVDEVYGLPFQQVHQNDVHVRVGAATGQSRVIGERIGRRVDITLALDELTLLHVMLIDPLHKIQELYPSEKVIILIDALDELEHHPGLKILDVLPPVIDAPANLRLVMTSRRTEQLKKGKFRSDDLLFLDDEKRGYRQASQKDIRRYIDKRLSEAPFVGIIASWTQDEVDAYVAKVVEHSQDNFLYLYYFFNELASNAEITPIDLHRFGIPKGLDEVYRAFALGKIRQNAESAIRITLVEEIPAPLVAQLKTIPSVSQVEVINQDVLLITTDSDQVTSGLFRLLPAVGVHISNFQTQKAEQLGVWEEKYLPILGVMAVAYEPLRREQIADFAGVEVIYIDSVLSRLKEFLDEVVYEKTNAYQFYHLSFSDYLLDSQRNREYPLDGQKYHYQIASYYRRGRATWDEVDWGTYTDIYPFNHLTTHLVAVNRTEELHQLLFNFSWLQAKLNATDAITMLSDFNHLPGDPYMHSLQNALQLSAHILIRDTTQLAGQLLGRLLPEEAPETQRLLEQAKRWNAAPWLRPLIPSLTAAGGALVRTLTGHTHDVYAVAVTPDGRQVISASLDMTLKVWDLTRGVEQRTLLGHTSGVLAVAVTPDGHKAISASADTTLKVWNLQTGQVLQTLEGHKGGVYAVAVTPDGRRVISASQDTTLKVWNLQTGQILQTLEGHIKSVWAVAVTPDGHQAISASADATLKMWDLQTGQIICTLVNYDEPFHAVTVTPDGQWVLSGSTDKIVMIWDLKSGKRLRTLHGHTDYISAIAVSPDGRYALSVAGSPSHLYSFDKTLKVWDLKLGTELRTLHGHTDGVLGVALTPDGQYAITASTDRTLKVWGLENRLGSSPLMGHTDDVNRVRVTPDGQRALSASNDGTVKVWNLESGEELLTLRGHTAPVWNLEVLPDNQRAVTASLDRTIRIWDLNSESESFTLRGHTDRITGLAVTANGKLALSESDDETLKLWDLDNSKELFTLGVGRYDTIALTSIGNRAIASRLDFALQVWDLEQGKELFTLPGHTGVVIRLVVTEDGRKAISASWDHTLSVWDLEHGKELHTLYGHTRDVYAVAVTPNGRQAISGSLDTTLKVWDLEHGKELHSLSGHTAAVYEVAMTSDGLRAISASDDTTLKVWNLQTGTVIATFSAESQLRTCAIGPDGKTVVAGDIDGRVYILHLEGV